MRQTALRTAFSWASMLALCGAAVCAQTDERAPGSGPTPTLLRLAVGGTTPVADEAGGFERVLVMPPDAEGASVGNAWEISADLAIKLARVPREERWRTIRRNLGLRPDDGDDLILWTEIADAAFESIARLPLENEAGGREFGLRVAFPGKDTSDPPADVALVFASPKSEGRPSGQLDVEAGLKQGITDAMTGVEGFVEFAADGASSGTSDELSRVEVRLFDSAKQFVAASRVRQGYFCFPGLRVDPDFGADYYLTAAVKDEEVGGTSGLIEGGAGGQTARASSLIYVPVMRGIRSRVRLTAPRPQMSVHALGEKGLQTQDWAISGGAAALLLQQFVEGSSLLGAITQRLPANPGLHLGVVDAPDVGLTAFWSARFVLRPPVLDRRPQFVARGKMRLQCLTVAGTPGAAARHYVKMTWLGHAAPAELKLSSRRVSETPWGIGIGVAPSAEPALYAVGVSYKLVRVAELFTGVGIQEDRGSSFVYGLTLDVAPILDGIFGRSTE